MKPRWPVTALLLCVLAAAGACAIPSNTTQPVREDSAPSWDGFTVEDDIPVPSRFKYQNSQSIIKKTPVMRYLDLVYKGFGDFYEVVSFYRDEAMADAGWKFQEQTSFGGLVILDFLKGPEKCKVHVVPNIFSITVRIEVYAVGAPDEEFTK